MLALLPHRPIPVTPLVFSSCRCASSKPQAEKDTTSTPKKPAKIRKIRLAPSVRRVLATPATRKWMSPDLPQRDYKITTVFTGDGAVADKVLYILFPFPLFP